MKSIGRKQKINDDRDILKKGIATKALEQDGLNNTNQNSNNSKFRYYIIKVKTNNNH